MDKTISISASASASAPSDLVTLSITTEIKNKNYDILMDADSTACRSLTQKLTDAGFPEKDLRTTSFNVGTEYNYRNEEQHFVGYCCSHSYELTFDFSSKALGLALYAASQSGTNPIINVNFSVKDRDTVRKNLLSKLAASARERAELLATASGVSIGQLISVDYSFSDEPSARGIMTFNCMSAKREAMADFAPGNITITENANFTWELIK